MGERYIPKNVFFLLEEDLIYDAPESATSSGPDSLNRISTSISGTSAGIRLPRGPRASDEADGNTGRSQPGFFRITGTKYFVPYRSQAKNISYPADHRQKIFRTLPQMAWGGEFFSSDIMWWDRSQLWLLGKPVLNRNNMRVELGRHANPRFIM